jgi:uncharacterized protein YbaP (TraB family)
MKNLLRTIAFLSVCLSASAQTSTAQDVAATKQDQVSSRAEVCPSAPDKPNLTPEMVQAGMRNARDHAFLWRISKDGRTSYLYGTIHVAKADWMFPGPNVLQALIASDTMALELDLVDPDIQAKMAKGVAALRNTELPESVVTRMRQLAASECVPYDAMAKLAPELQVMTLALMAGHPDGLDASYAIDAVLAGIGHGARKPVVSLETPESQLQLIVMRNPQETIAFVKDSLDDLEAGRSRAMIERMSKTWANGDYAEMTRFNEWCECLDTEVAREQMKRILDDRNPNLAAEIDELHHGGKQVFAAVGSLHMFGPIGLPALMEKRGYKVERVDLKAL